MIYRGKPRITNYLGECFLKIATHLSYKPNFVNYMFRDDMISDGIENCVQYIHNFNPEKSRNPFAYFTQIIHYAFLRRIQKEKKQLDIKTKIIEKSGYDEVMTVDDSSLAGSSSDYNTIKDIIYKSNQYRSRNNFYCIFTFIDMLCQNFTQIQITTFYAIITDTHYGARKGSDHLHNFFEMFYRDVFFPSLEKHQIDTVIHMGDIFDSRKSIDLKSLEWSKKVVFEPLKKYNVHAIVGNHDCYYKDTNYVNSPELTIKSISKY